MFRNTAPSLMCWYEFSYLQWQIPIVDTNTASSKRSASKTDLRTSRGTWLARTWERCSSNLQRNTNTRYQQIQYWQEENPKCYIWRSLKWYDEVLWPKITFLSVQQRSWQNWPGDTGWIDLLPWTFAVVITFVCCYINPKYRYRYRYVQLREGLDAR